MKYKVVEYMSDIQEEQTGTCELCFGTAMVENGSITVEDENGKATKIFLTWWSWGDYFTIYIDNVVNFSAWLQEQEVEPISKDTNLWSWLDKIVAKYYEEQEDELIEDFVRFQSYLLMYGVGFALEKAGEVEE